MNDRTRRPALPMLLAVSLILLAGCNLPAQQPPDDPFGTAAAETVAAQLTALVPQATTPAPTDEPTPTEQAGTPTTTSTPAPTGTTTPCDRAQFVSDVNYPDGTDVAPGAAFTKTWRLRNTGTCTWTSSYALVFDSGDSMGAPASTQLTVGTVAPGQTIDVSVNLTAPAAPGTYRGNFRLRNGSGVLFGIGDAGTGAFWVQIDVVPATTSVTLTAIEGESGSVRSNGSVLGPRNVGDTPDNVSSQAFWSFNISGIPAGSVVTNVTFNLTGYDTLGSPFGTLGCLYLYKQDYGSLDAGDFVVGLPGGAMIRICGTGGLGSAVADNDFVTAVQSKIGSSRFQMRAQFETAVSANGVGDMVRFPPIQMTVTYYTP